MCKVQPLEVKEMEVIWCLQESGFRRENSKKRRGNPVERREKVMNLLVVCGFCVVE